MGGNLHAVPHSVIYSWPKPNYVDPVSRDWLPAFSCTLLGVATFLVAGRFYLRVRKAAGEFGLDDLFMIIAWLFSAALTATAIIDADWYYLRVHVWDMPRNLYVPAALTGWIAQVFFLCSTCATKASVLLFYRRITKDSYSKGMLYAIWAALGFTAVYFVTILISYCLLCQPLDAYWLSYGHTYDKPFTCIDGRVWSPVVGIVSVISDIYAVLLPCIWLYRYNLQISKRQRISLNIIFSLGTIVAACGIVRTYYLIKMDHTYDITWYGYDLFVWSLLECDLAIIFACAPSLRAFIRRYLPDPTVRGTVRSLTSPNKRRTKDIYEDYWGDRTSSALGNPKGGEKRMNAFIEERELTPAKPVELEEVSFDGSERGPSTETEPAPTIKNADDYEAHILQKFKRQTLGWRSTYRDRFSLASTASVTDHDLNDRNAERHGSDV